jgi:hypothetical protein
LIRSLATRHGQSGNSEYLHDGQASAVAPYTLAGKKQAEVRVEIDGSQSEAVRVAAPLGVPARAERRRTRALLGEHFAVLPEMLRGGAQGAVQVYDGSNPGAKIEISDISVVRGLKKEILVDETCTDLCAGRVRRHHLSM